MPDEPDAVDEPGPAIRRRQLARTLKEIRVAAGYRTVAAAAEATGLSSATVSRVERAEQKITPKTVNLMCMTYGVGAPMRDYLLRQARESDDRGWLVEYSATVPNWFQRYAGEEADATKIRSYESECVPGLLQTDDYTRAITTAARPDVGAERLEQSVAFRRKRQERLNVDKPPEIIAVINEGALRRRVGGARVMREQLLYLVDVAGRPNISLYMLPFSAGAHPAMISAFTVLFFSEAAAIAEGDITVYVEVYGGALYPDRPEDFDHYTWMHQQLAALALSPDETAEALVRLAAELNPGD